MDIRNGDVFTKRLEYLQEGFGMRLKGIHILSESKMVDSLTKIFKQMFSAKIGGRIYVHKTLDTLYEHVPREILPVEYGGQEKSIKKLSSKFHKILSVMVLSHRCL